MSLSPPIDLHPCQWLRVELHWVHLSILCGFVIIVFCVMNINSYAVSHETGCSVVSVLLFPLRLVLKITLKLCSSIEAQQLADSHWVIVTGCWKCHCVCRAERRWLAVSSQIGLHSDYMTDLETVERSHPSDFLLLQPCSQHSVNASERCDSNMEVYQYPHILQVFPVNQLTYINSLRGKFTKLSDFSMQRTSVLTMINLIFTRYWETHFVLLTDFVWNSPVVAAAKKCSGNWKSFLEGSLDNEVICRFLSF